MEVVVLCLVILRNMCFEERLEESDELSEEKDENEDSSLAVEKENTPMWGGLGRPFSTNTTHEPCAIAVLCEVSILMGYKA